MSKIVKPIALDETLQLTNSKLDALSSRSGSTNDALTTLDTDLKNQTTAIGAKITDHATAVGGKIDGLGTKITTLDSNLGTKIDGLGTKITTLDTDLKAQTAKQTEDMGTLLSGLIGVLASVKSINGKYGVVVLDSGDILINRTVSGSKTVRQMLSEMETAVGKTAVQFAVSKIEEEDYSLSISLGTPA